MCKRTNKKPPIAVGGMNKLITHIIPHQEETKMNEFVLASDKGICEFCGQPIEMYENECFVRRIEEDEARIAHFDCFEEYKEEE